MILQTISKNSNNYKNSDMSYIPSSNDDNISYPLNNPNNNRGNIKKIKTIHTSETY